MLKRLTVLKRLTASLVIVAWTLMSVESAVGELRDGEVHHESASEAARHRAESAGGFGHEHTQEPGGGQQEEQRQQDGELQQGQEYQQGQEHDHDSAADHCTHVHGVGLISTTVITTVRLAEHAWDHPSPCVHSYVPAEVLPHPPKV